MPRFPCAQRIQWPWCTKFDASHITPYTLWNYWHNYTTMLDIFGITCIFPDWSDDYLYIKLNMVTNCQYSQCTWKRTILLSLHSRVYHQRHFFNNESCSYDFIVPCISGNRLTCFISLKFSSPPCPWQPKFWNYNGGQKIKLFIPFHFGVYKMCLYDRISNLVSELKLITYLTPFWQKR